MGQKTEEPRYEINVFFGHMEVRSWFEFQLDAQGRETLVGMGSRTAYDTSGRITEHKAEPTGVVACWR